MWDHLHGFMAEEEVVTPGTSERELATQLSGTMGASWRGGYLERRLPGEEASWRGLLALGVQECGLALPRPGRIVFCLFACLFLFCFVFLIIPATLLDIPKWL